jgi:hypothetical protein
MERRQVKRQVEWPLLVGPSHAGWQPRARPLQMERRQVKRPLQVGPRQVEWQPRVGPPQVEWQLQAGPPQAETESRPEVAGRRMRGASGRRGWQQAPPVTPSRFAADGAASRHGGVGDPMHGVARDRDGTRHLQPNSCVTGSDPASPSIAPC